MLIIVSVKADAKIGDKWKNNMGNLKKLPMLFLFLVLNRKTENSIVGIA